MYQGGPLNIAHFALSMLGATGLLAILSLILLVIMVVSRLARLSASLKSITSNGKMSERISMPGTDEMSGLASDINRILAELERSHSERERLEEQLRHAQKMEAVGRLAGGIAHDFNNLLTAIIGYSHMGMTKVSARDPLSGYLQEIDKAALRASDLTRQLLAFSRRQTIEPKVINLNDLILNMDKMLRRLIGEDIELVALLAQDGGLVKVDPGQIEQAVINLAVNARDAMPDGGKLILKTTNVAVGDESAREHQDVAPGTYVLLTVRDTGIGMTEEVKAHAFEPFFTTKEVDKDTGLGLSTCYGIVSQAGGYLAVDTDPGHGATFKIYLPKVDEEVSPAYPGPPDDSPVGTETVLVVEDEPSVRQMASTVLRDQGYTVLQAADGHEAVRVAGEHAAGEVHLVLTDVVMPLMSGKELATRLKGTSPATKVLFTSGYTDDVVARHGVRESGSEFMQKPFTPSVLACKVREVLDKKIGTDR